MTATLPPADLHTLLSPSTAEHKSSGLQHILAPRSIAVVGASRRPNSMGHQVLKNLLTYGFQGAVYPVNPRAHNVCGVRAAATVSAIGEPVDLAIVVVPQPQVLDVVKDACDAGTRGLVVITAGYREIGEAGAAHERQLTSYVRGRGVRMVGPNCMGVVNADPAVSMNATFATAMPPFGGAAFVSQSGALGLNVLDHAREYGIGISQFVSIGNKPDVSGNDLLLEWETDPAIRVILMYVESFGNPQRFLEIARRISRQKPIVVVKSGRSQAGAHAASSHTGALATSDTAVDAMLAQAGVLRATSIEELFDIARAFTVPVFPASHRIAVLTNAGGPGIMAADAMEAAGVELPALSAATVDALRPLFPSTASIRNPLDMVASAQPAGYTEAISALLDDPVIDTVVPIFVPPFGVRQEDVASAIVSAAAHRKDKAMLAVLMGREGLNTGRDQLSRVGVPTFIYPESAARAMGALVKHVHWAARSPAAPFTCTLDEQAISSLIARARKDRRERLDELESLELLRACGIHTADAMIARNANDIRIACTRLDFPLVMKIVSPDISHKSDVGGVVTGLLQESAVMDAYFSMLRRVAAKAPDARITGVLLQRTVPPGREMIVGFTREQHFGPLVMFGLGGVLVEAMHDTVFRMTPLTVDDAREMVHGIRSAAILREFRGQPPVDTAALEQAIGRVAQLAERFPEIAELDVNPLVARPSGVIAADARVRLQLAPAPQR